MIKTKEINFAEYETKYFSKLIDGKIKEFSYSVKKEPRLTRKEWKYFMIDIENGQ